MNDNQKAPNPVAGDRLAMTDREVAALTGPQRWGADEEVAR